MSNFVQLSYASTATSLPEVLGEDLTDILNEARLFNQQHHITGVLYFGHGKFFQYLEGDADAMAGLYEKLLQDRRHKDVRILSQGKLTQPLFVGWSMKYIALNPALQDWLAQRQLLPFDPHQLQGDTLTEFVLRLQAEHGILPDHTPSTALPPPTTPPAMASRERLLGLAIAVLAALMLVAAFWWVQ